MTENRGRPKENNTPRTGKFKDVFTGEDGVISKWYYDTDRNNRGPIKGTQT